MKRGRGEIILRDCVISIEPLVTLKKRPILFLLLFTVRALGFTGNAPRGWPVDIEIWDPKRQVRLWREGAYRSPQLEELLTQFQSQIDGAEAAAP
jgi:hypothetical protein